MFEKISHLSAFSGQIDTILDNFRAYKRVIPVMGGILLDREMDRVLLVRGFKSSAGKGGVWRAEGAREGKGEAGGFAGKPLVGGPGAPQRG